jgi:hypothetical protein
MGGGLGRGQLGGRRQWRAFAWRRRHKGNRRRRREEKKRRKEKKEKNMKNFLNLKISEK